MTDEEERRRHRRLTTRSRVGLRPVSGEGPTQAEMRDVSESGAGLVTDRQLKRGDQIEVELRLAIPDVEGPETVKTMAEVMWSAETDTGAYAAGLKFKGPSPEALARLKRFLAKELGEPDDA
jgi:hypothetical protein